jgi:hypothetical protein
MTKRLLLVFVCALIVSVLALGNSNLEASSGLFDSPLPEPPVNDSFVKAIDVSGIPFIHNTTTEGATLQDEPLPGCAYDPTGSIWYAFTPSESGSVMAQTQGTWFDTYLGIYTGASLHNLTEIGSRCGYWENRLAFQASAGETYYIQVGGMWGQAGPLEFSLVSTPPPEVYLYYYPYPPSIYSTVQFYVDCWDPAYIGCDTDTYEWDLGDGTTAEGCCPTHNYAADGDYTVELVATTYDGRTGSTSQIVQVQTHDVAITEFHTPNRAEVGETHRIVVGLSNREPYNEEVYLQLYKSVPGEYWSWEEIGYAYGQVPAHKANRTVDFEFAYTFTEEDATAKTVSFRAVANMWSWPDALPGDNEAISLPTLIKPLH